MSKWVCCPAWVNELLCCSGPCRLRSPRISSSDRWSKSWRESSRIASRSNSNPNKAELSRRRVLTAACACVFLSVCFSRWRRRSRRTRWGETSWTTSTWSCSTSRGSTSKLSKTLKRWENQRETRLTFVLALIITPVSLNFYKHMSTD